VLLAAAATAKALAQTGAKDTGKGQPRRRGGRPPPTKRASPRPRPRRTRTQQGQHNPPTANSLLREGQNRPRPGAPFTSSNHAASSAMPATLFAPPLSPAVTRRNGRDIAESV
jgi:hypothetical protein